MLVEQNDMGFTVTSSMTSLNSSSFQLFGTFPIRNLFVVFDCEHLIVLPCNDDIICIKKKITYNTIVPTQPNHS